MNRDPLRTNNCNTSPAKLTIQSFQLNSKKCMLPGIGIHKLLTSKDSLTLMFVFTCEYAQA